MVDFFFFSLHAGWVMIITLVVVFYYIKLSNTLVFDFYYIKQSNTLMVDFYYIINK